MKKKHCIYRCGAFLTVANKLAWVLLVIQGEANISPEEGNPGKHKNENGVIWMKIVVCYKYIPDENEIKVQPDRTLDTSAASWMISPYDLNALEAGMRLAALQENSTVEVLTVGGEVVDNSKMRKAILSRGPSKMYAIRKEGFVSGLLTTATLLKQGIEKIGGVDVVICGEGSGDMYSQQLGNLLGALMHVPTLNSVSGLSYENGKVIAERVAGNRTEVYEIEGPVILSVSSDICMARIASMKEILAAGKKPVEVWDADEFAAQTVDRVETVSILAPQSTERKQEIYDNSEDGIEKFCLAIRKSL